MCFYLLKSSKNRAILKLVNKNLITGSNLQQILTPYKHLNSYLQICNWHFWFFRDLQMFIDL